MQYRRLGKSKLKVSALCLGSMLFGDQTDLNEAERIVASAREHGINFIDTANVYGQGRSERMLGTLLAPDRHAWVLASKLGHSLAPKPSDSHYSRKRIIEEVERA